MPAPILTRAERQTFDAAIETIEAAKRAWENDDEPLVIDLNEMVAAKRAIGQMLARHTDSRYTLHEDHYRRIILQRYEIIATDLLPAISTSSKRAVCIGCMFVRLTHARESAAFLEIICTCVGSILPYSGMSNSARFQRSAML